MFLSLDLRSLVTNSRFVLASEMDIPTHDRGFGPFRAGASCGTSLDSVPQVVATCHFIAGMSQRALQPKSGIHCAPSPMPAAMYPVTTCLCSSIVSPTRVRTCARAPLRYVHRTPFPSMPVSFWGDSDGSKYRSAYFEAFEGEDVWAHGDYVKVVVTMSAVGSRQPSMRYIAFFLSERNEASTAKIIMSGTLGLQNSTLSVGRFVYIYVGRVGSAVH